MFRWLMHPQTKEIDHSYYLLTLMNVMFFFFCYFAQHVIVSFILVSHLSTNFVVYLHLFLSCRIMLIESWINTLPIGIRKAVASWKDLPIFCTFLGCVSPLFFRLLCSLAVCKSSFSLIHSIIAKSTSWWVTILIITSRLLKGI